MSTLDQTADWRNVREQILERDQRRCGCCGRPEWAVDALDVHHIVPRGAGGSDRFGNYRVLCRECHEAVTSEDVVAPGIEIQSTGRMDQYTFIWFKHFLNEMVPAMSRAVGVRMNPRFGLVPQRDYWHIPLGDIRLCDAALSSSDVEYDSMRAEDYM